MDFLSELKEKLNQFWDSDSKGKYFLKFLYSIFFIVSRFIKTLHREFYIWRILSSRTRWYISKRGNLYNPIFEATIYPSNGLWNIARFDVHHQGFFSKQHAKNIAFQMWYHELPQRAKQISKCHRITQALKID